MTSVSKTCAKCHVERPISDFYSDPSKRDSKHTVCRICKTKSKGAVRRGPDPGIPPGSVKCSRCAVIKPVDEFHKSQNKGKYGIRQPCKQCRTKTNKSRDVEKRFRCLDGVHEARCTKCNTWRPLDRFTVLKRNGKLCSHCKQCKVADAKTWKEKNIDKVVRRRLLTEERITRVGSFTNSEADRKDLLVAIAKRYRGYLESDKKRVRKRLDRVIHGLTKEEVKARLSAVEPVAKVPVEEFLDFILSRPPKCECCNRDLDMTVSSIDFAIDHFHDTGRLRGLLCNDCNLGIGSFQDSIAVLKAAKRYLESHHAKRDVSKVRK